MITFETALAYVKDDRLPVFPVSISWNGTKFEKKPAVKWKDYQDRLPTEKELHEWFDKPQYNGLGLATGKLSGVVVVDVEKAMVDNVQIYSPWVVNTISGGKHYYFRWKEELRNAVRLENKEVDFRGDGGYVVLPPSECNDKSYSWEKRTDSMFLGTLPDEYRKVVKLEKPEKYDIKTAFNVSQGTRNSEIKSAIASLVQKHDSQTAWKLTVALNNTYDPPFSKKELDETFTYILSRFGKRENKQTQDYQIPTHEQDIDRVKQEYLEGKTIGYPSGFSSLDRITSGLLPKQSYLIFADTNSGKSVFILNILHFLSMNQIPCMYFDLENDLTTSTERQVLINEGVLTPQIWKEMVLAKKIDEPLEHLKLLPLYTWDLTKLNDRFGGITFESVESCIREGVVKGCKIFAIDHLHYFEPSETNHDKLADISRRINDLCATLNITILVVAHTKKGKSYIKLDQVKTTRPILDDVLGSILITKHTKNCIGIMRNDKSSDELERRKTFVFVDKTKAGQTGRFSLDFNPDNLRFVDPFQYQSDPFVAIKGGD